MSGLTRSTRWRRWCGCAPSRPLSRRCGSPTRTPRCAHAVHMLCTHHAHAMNTPYTCHAHAMHMPFTCYAYACRQRAVASQYCMPPHLVTRRPSSRGLATTRSRPMPRRSATPCCAAILRPGAGHVHAMHMHMHMPCTCTCHAHAMHMPCACHAHAHAHAHAQARS